MNSINEILENLRGNYLSARLDIQDCSSDPAVQFDKWFNEALTAKCDEPNAFVLSTASNGQPRGRVVLLKGVDSGKFIFYSNYKSAKGEELLQNDKVSATFLWLPLQRQIRIEGTVSKVEGSISDLYFQKRPRGSQLGAIASPQSQKITRSELEEFFSSTEKKFEQQEILTRPGHWGGYAITPNYFEFWQGRNNRMHDRISYLQTSSGWKLERLAP